MKESGGRIGNGNFCHADSIFSLLVKHFLNLLGSLGVRYHKELISVLGSLIFAYAHRCPAPSVDMRPEMFRILFQDMKDLVLRTHGIQFGVKPERMGNPMSLLRSIGSRQQSE